MQRVRKGKLKVDIKQIKTLRKLTQRITSNILYLYGTEEHQKPFFFRFRIALKIFFSS